MNSFPVFYIKKVSVSDGIIALPVLHQVNF